MSDPYLASRVAIKTGILAASLVAPAAMSTLARTVGYGKRKRSWAQWASGKRRPTSVPRSLYIKGVHKFKRTVAFPLAYIPSTGIGGSSDFGVGLSCSMTNVYWSTLSGSAGVPIPGASDLQNLFDTYRIDKMVVKVFFQDTGSNTGSGSTGMPVISYVNDNTTPPQNYYATASQILQFQGVRQYQHGNGATKGGCLQTSVVPRAKQLTGMQAGPPGTNNSAGSASDKAFTWYETRNQGEANTHFGTLFYFDPAGATQTTKLGTFSFYVDVYFTCKDVN